MKLEISLTFKIATGEDGEEQNPAIGFEREDEDEDDEDI